MRERESNPRLLSRLGIWIGVWNSPGMVGSVGAFLLPGAFRLIISQPISGIGGQERGVGSGGWISENLGKLVFRTECEGHFNFGRGWRNRDIAVIFPRSPT